MRKFKFRFVAQFLYSNYTANYTIELVNNSTAALDYMRNVRTVFCPDFFGKYSRSHEAESIIEVGRKVIVLYRL